MAYALVNECMYMVWAMTPKNKYIAAVEEGRPTKNRKGTIISEMMDASVTIFAKPLPLFFMKAFHGAWRIAANRMTAKIDILRCKPFFG